MTLSNDAIILEGTTALERLLYLTAKLIINY